MIPTAVVDEESLAAEAEEAANLYGFDDRFESGGDVIVRRKECIHGSAKLGAAGIKLCLEEQLRVVALLGEARETFGEEVGVMLFERAAQRRVLELKQIAGCAAGIAVKG